MGYKIGNIDSVKVAQSPKLSAYIDSMRENIAKACKTDVSNISIKQLRRRTRFTGEKLGIVALHMLAESEIIIFHLWRYMSQTHTISYLSKWRMI